MMRPWSSLYWPSTLWRGSVLEGGEAVLNLTQLGSEDLGVHGQHFRPLFVIATRALLNTPAQAIVLIDNT